MYNGLADAIWVGTKHKAEAAKWVNFLASKDCQSIVGSEAVVFPAIQSEVPKAVAKHKAEGRDVSAFTSYIESGNTVLYPITDKAPQINLIVQPTLEEFLNGDEDATKVFKDMNEQVNNQLQFSGTGVMAVLAHLTPLTALLAVARVATSSRAPTAGPRCGSTSRWPSTSPRSSACWS